MRVAVAGEVIGRVTAVQLFGRDKRGDERWLWRCACGEFFASRVMRIRYLSKRAEVTCMKCWIAKQTETRP